MILLRGNHTLTALLLFLASNSLFGQSTPPVPAGLWQNQEEGFVIRIESCGSGLCGFAAGQPKNNKKKSAEEICGKPMLKDFVWSDRAKRWEGQMQPPDSNMKLNSSIQSDGKTFLVLKGKILLISKTMNFIPYTGKIGEGCRLE